MNSETIVNLISKGKNSNAQEIVNDLLYVKSGELLSQYKQKLGQSLFGQEEE
jgi:hypothetical protein